MSDKEAKEGAVESGAKGGGLPVKTVAIVVVMLVVEAVAVLGAVMVLGKPSEVQAVELHDGEADEGDRLVELRVVSEKFTNNSSGRVWIWDTEVVLVTRMKYAGAEQAGEGQDGGDGHGGGGEGSHDAHAGVQTLRSELFARRAQVRTGIGAIMSSAQHSYFTEPGRETLSRQMLEYLRTIFGPDAEGHERIDKVLIPKCLGFPADY